MSLGYSGPKEAGCRTGSKGVKKNEKLVLMTREGDGLSHSPFGESEIPFRIKKAKCLRTGKAEKSSAGQKCRAQKKAGGQIQNPKKG